jgi:putative FmdB family regulatory protein
LPLYEYECQQCGRFEKNQKISHKPLKTCPTCGKKGVERLLSAPAIQFKGSGWYITDYARKSSGGSNKDGGKEGKSEGGTTESGKTESGKESGSKCKTDVAAASTSTSSGKSGSDKS